MFDHFVGLALKRLAFIIRPGQPILVGLIDLVNSHNFSILSDFTQIVNFATWIPDCDSHSPAPLDLFLLTLVFDLQWLSYIWKF